MRIWKTCASSAYLCLCVVVATACENAGATDTTPAAEEEVETEGPGFTFDRTLVPVTLERDRLTELFDGQPRVSEPLRPDLTATLAEQGREVFRFDTFGSERFWGDALRLHDAIAGEANGGVGEGLSPEQALALGLRVDVEALPQSLQSELAAGRVDLTDPATTLALLELDAVIGVTGFFEPAGEEDGAARRLTSVGIQCALCHTDVDDSFAPGIGRRLDGWPPRSLDIGAIVATAPDLSPFASLLGVDEETVRDVLRSWGPGRYDAQLVLDGKAFRPDGETAAVLLPAAFGLAGVNLHTYTGFGSVAYWNAYVAVTQMNGVGRFYDPRLADAEQFPVAARAGLYDVRPEGEDRVTPKLPALHAYQMSLTPPSPPIGSFDAERAERGRELFEGRAMCASCHVPPLYTEPGHNVHAPEDIGIDDFQASRSPTGGYRTTPLRGLFTRTRGGFYHDGRFATLDEVIQHYDSFFDLDLSAEQRGDLREFLKSL